MLMSRGHFRHLPVSGRRRPGRHAGHHRRLPCADRPRPLPAPTTGNARSR